MDFALPQIGEGVYEAELVRWLVQPGDAVKRGQAIVEVMTDKATMEVPAPFIGTIHNLRAEAGQTIKVGDVILSFDGKEQPVTKPNVANEDLQVKHNGTVAPSGRVPVKAAPSVRHLARKLNVDLNSVRGSGPDGRVLIEDLTNRIAQVPAAPVAAKTDYGRPGTRLKMQGLRKRIAEHMTLSRRAIPDFTLIEECDVTELVKLRENLKEPFAKKGVSLTYLPFFVKAVVTALKELPIVNASLDEAAGEIVLHDRYHIGIAVATPGGLMVPVLKDADKKDLAGLAAEINRLGSEARAGKSKLEDLRGSTFTVTSVGNVGGLISTPIINHPEVGILGLGRAVKRPVYDERDQIRPAHLLYLSLSFDHRVVDGAVAVAFTNIILRELRNPTAMLAN